MRRTPKYYDGTARTGRLLSELLEASLSEIRAIAGAQGDEVFRYFQELMGEKMAALTEPVSLVDGVLMVRVKSQTLYGLLCQHERPRLLKELQKKFSIRGLTFRVG